MGLSRLPRRVLQPAGSHLGHLSCKLRSVFYPAESHLSVVGSSDPQDCLEVVDTLDLWVGRLDLGLDP